MTFLFTDIEGSTRRWEADPEGMQVALAAHDEVLRGAIETHEGWLFKHIGDAEAHYDTTTGPGQAVGESSDLHHLAGANLHSST